MRARSQAPSPSARSADFVSVYGVARVYTRRHINGCPLVAVDDNGCSCPKWIYAKARGERARQFAAKTPSFSEALGEAQKIWKGFDPEIRAARQIVQPPAPGITIEAALEQYFAACAQRGVSASTLQNYRAPLARRSPRPSKSGRATMHMSLLDYLDHSNVAAREPIVRMEQLTSQALDRWNATWKTNDLSTHTYRGIVTTFLEWARLHGHLKTLPEFRERHRVKVGNRCGHFTNEEFARIREAVPFYRVQHQREPANYSVRLAAFVDIGRWAGMALCDIVRFRPAADLDYNNVLTYRRKKSGQIAAVLLDPAVAARLRSIPPEEGSDPERPFHFPETSEYRNKGKWRDRFQKLCIFAGVTSVETEIGDRVAPHPHMLRDTFAIDAITRGVSLDNVAKMLGHATTVMTQRSYLQWIKKRLDHCIEDQRQALTRVQVAPPPSNGEARGSVTLRATLVH